MRTNRKLLAASSSAYFSCSPPFSSGGVAAGRNQKTNNQLTFESMKILKLIFVIAAASILAALLLWFSLAVGAAEPLRYLALARAPCLLSGSVGALIGTTFGRPRTTLCGLMLLVAGLASFWYRDLSRGRLPCTP